MGGKKKLSLKQIERMQARKDKQEKKKSKKTELREMKTAMIAPPDIKDKGVIKEIRKMRVLTPYTVATHLNMRISAAKQFLTQLEEHGVIKIVTGDHNLKIYEVAD